MELKIKRLKKFAQLPKKSHASDACFDLYATDFQDGLFSGSWIFNTGIAIEIPEGYYGQILTRSSCAKKGLIVLGGVIDSGYRGEVKVIIYTPVVQTAEDAEEMEKSFEEYTTKQWTDIAYMVGKPIAQLAILPVPKFEVVESQDLSETDRGVGGLEVQIQNNFDWKVPK